MPYFKAKIETMRAINPGRCKPFGEQRGAETDMSPLSHGAKHLWPGVKQCPPKII